MLSRFFYGHIGKVGIEVGSRRRLIIANGEQELLVMGVVIITPGDTQTAAERNLIARQGE